MKKYSDRDSLIQSGRLRIGCTAALSALLLLLLNACGSSSHDSPTASQNSTAAQACTALSGQSVGSAHFVTSLVAASGDVPLYCKVQGKIGPSLNFEMRLPDQWNGRLHYIGGGGYNGSIPPLTGPDAHSRLPLVALKRGFVTIASDSGHQGSSVDASFALNDPVAAELYGSLSVPTVMASAVKAIAAAYGAPPVKSYFEGCSNGGREALMSVQRFPNLFDGVIARAPGYNAVGFIGHFNLTAKLLAAPGGMLNAAKIGLLADRVRKACDGLDGIRDGIVSNPAACTPALVNYPALRCGGGVDSGDSCLSDAQLAVVNAWTSDVNWAGSPTFRNAGWSLSGNEDAPGVWDAWLTGYGDVTHSARFLLQDTTIKNLMARDPKVNSLQYAPYDQNTNQLFALGVLSDATNPDISPFIANGGKLILWQGASDPALSTHSTIEYYKHLRDAVGATKADAAAKLYFAPGVGHCAGGPGADAVDLLAALDDWSSKGSAPGTLTSTKWDAATGAVALSMPLCQYPLYPRYTGPVGDAAAAKLAAHFTCSAP